jgi:DNA (cytosine-5)-methyltransferase 1
MRALSLFSGIGGIDLACEWAGIETVAFCEIDPFCRKVLAKHWPGVPCFEDVTKLKGSDVGTVDIITGGYPCQPFSTSGKRLGENDPRHLWPEFYRLVRELRPRWVLGENVAGHVSLGLDQVLSDLESANYTARAFVYEAAAVGALHLRARCFVVAHSNDFGGWQTEELGAKSQSAAKPRTYGKAEPVAHASSFGMERQRLPVRQGRQNQATCNLDGGSQNASYSSSLYVEGQPYGSGQIEPWRGGWWLSEPSVGRVVDGFPDELARERWNCELRAFGNAVVPQQVHPILAAIKQIHTENP